MKEYTKKELNLVTLKKEKLNEKWRSPSRVILREEERLEDNLERRRQSKMKAERRLRRKKSSGGWTRVKIAIGVKRENEDCDCCDFKNNQLHIKQEKKRNKITYHIMAYYYEPKISLSHYVNMDMHSKMMNLASMDRCKHLIADIQTIGKDLDIEKVLKHFEDDIKNFYEGKNVDSIRQHQYQLFIEHPLTMPALPRPVNSLLIDTPTPRAVEKMQECIAAIGASGLTSWDRHNNKSITTVHFMYNAQLMSYIRIFGDTLSRRDSLYAFKEWPHVGMAVKVTAVPGDIDEHGEKIEKYVCQYNCDWPTQSILDEVVSDHNEKWSEIERQNNLFWVKHPGAQRPAFTNLKKPIQADYPIDRFIRENMDLQAWANDWRLNDRLEQVKTSERKIKRPEGDQRAQMSAIFRQNAMLEMKMQQMQEQLAHQEAVRRSGELIDTPAVPTVSAAPVTSPMASTTPAIPPVVPPPAPQMPTSPTSQPAMQVGPQVGASTIAAHTKTAASVENHEEGMGEGTEEALQGTDTTNDLCLEECPKGCKSCKHEVSFVTAYDSIEGHFKSFDSYMSFDESAVAKIKNDETSAVLIAIQNMTDIQDKDNIEPPPAGRASEDDDIPDDRSVCILPCEELGTLEEMPTLTDEKERILNLCRIQNEKRNNILKKADNTEDLHEEMKSMKIDQIENEISSSLEEDARSLKVQYEDGIEEILDPRAAKAYSKMMRSSSLVSLVSLDGGNREQTWEQKHQSIPLNTIAKRDAEDKKKLKKPKKSISGQSTPNRSASIVVDSPNQSSIIDSRLQVVSPAVTSSGRKKVKAANLPKPFTKENGKKVMKMKKSEETPTRKPVSESRKRRLEGMKNREREGIKPHMKTPPNMAQKGDSLNSSARYENVAKSENSDSSGYFTNNSSRNISSESKEPNHEENEVRNRMNQELNLKVNNNSELKNILTELYDQNPFRSVHNEVKILDVKTVNDFVVLSVVFGDYKAKQIIMKTNKFNIANLEDNLIFLINYLKSKPSSVYFIDKGRCEIVYMGYDKLPEVKRKGIKVEFTEFSKFMLMKYLEYLKLNEIFLRPLSLKLGELQLNEQKKMLEAYANSYTYQEDEEILEEDIVDTDNMEYVGKPERKIMNEWLNLNGLPIFREEHEGMKKAKTLMMKKARNLDVNKKFLRTKYSIYKDLKHYYDMTYIKKKKKFKKKYKNMKHEDEEEVEMARARRRQGRDLEVLESIPEAEEEDQELPYHHFYDGTPIYLERVPVKDEDFDEAEEEEIRRRPSNNESSRFIKIGYANVQNTIIQSNHKNILQDITEEWPDVDIWLFCELMWNETLFCQCPIEYKMLTHDKFFKKTTMVIYKRELQANIQQRKSELNETSFTLDVNKRQIGFTVFYRSPTRKNSNKFYENMNPYLPRIEGSDHPMKKYAHWMCNKVGRLMQSGDEVVAGDFNMSLHDEPRHEFDTIGQIELRTAFESIWPNYLMGKDTYSWKDRVTGAQKFSSIDVIACNKPSRILELKRLNDTTSSMHSDHYVWSFVIDSSLKTKNQMKILSKKKLKNETETQRNQSKEIIEEVKKAMKTEMRRTNDTQKILEAMISKSKEKLPIRKIKPGIQSNTLNFSLDVVNLKKERQEYMKSNNIYGLGAFYTRRNQRLKTLNMKIHKAKKKAKRALWEKKLGRMATSRDVWNLLKIFKNEKTTYPEWVSRNGTCKFFKQLSWNYEPLKLSLINRGNRTPHKRTVTMRNPDDARFNFNRLGRRAMSYWNNLKKMVLDGKGSDFSYAPDEMTLNVLKNLDEEGWDMLTDCMDEFIRTGRYLKLFRHQKMTTVPKKPVIEIYKHLRPVTISSALVNILEKVLAKMFYRGCEILKWLHPNQYGFRSAYGIGMLISDMKKMVARRKGEFFVVIQTDQSNAFGSPDIEAILKELNDRISDGAFDTVKSFLIQSSAAVKIDGEDSIKFKTAPRGFAQGSCWSPIMFCTLMTNSHHEVTALGLTFADDANFIDDFDTLEEMKTAIIKTVKEFKKFCERLNICLNVSKTFYLSDLNVDLELKIDEEKINHQEKMNMLGIRMKHDLSIGPQILHIKQKVKTVRYIIYTFGTTVRCEKSNSVIMRSFVHGLFNHGAAYLPVWDPEDYKEVQKSVNAALSKLSGFLVKKEYLEGKITDGKEKAAIRRAIARYSAIKDKYHYFNKITVPQWLLLRRHNLMSIENLHRYSWTSRMTKLLKTGRPKKEYDELCKYMIDNLRNVTRRVRETANYPYFKIILNEDENIADNQMILETAPSIWIQEFLKLDSEVRLQIMTSRFASRFVKEFYNKRCQHREENNTRCDNCERVHTCYRNTIIKQKLVDLKALEETSHEWYQKNIRILKDGNWYNTVEDELEILQADDIVAIDWDTPNERYVFAEKLGLELNACLQEALKKLRTLGL